jgi:hypothetical protein
MSPTARKIKVRQFQQSLFPRKQQSIPTASIPFKSEGRASWGLRVPLLRQIAKPPLARFLPLGEPLRPPNERAIGIFRI